MFDSFEARVALAKEFRKYRPKVVIGFGDKTPMASPDHWQAMQITDAAVFYSRLSKWDEYFDGLPVHPIAVQLYFRLAFEPATLHNYSSHFTVDIGETLESKLAAIRCYETQFPPAKAYVFDRIRGAKRVEQERIDGVGLRGGLRRYAFRPASAQQAGSRTAQPDDERQQHERGAGHANSVPAHARCSLTPTSWSTTATGGTTGSTVRPGRG